MDTHTLASDLAGPAAQVAQVCPSPSVQATAFSAMGCVGGTGAGEQGPFLPSPSVPVPKDFGVLCGIH